MISLLLVDDEVQFLEVTKMFLEKGRGIRVTTARSGSEALDLLKTQKFDAIISDYAMPGMNGIELMKEVKALGDDTPFIIFTGKGREDVVIDALNFGADLYLEKSPDPRGQVSDILKRVRGLISSREEEREEKEKLTMVSVHLSHLPCIFFRQERGKKSATVLAGRGAASLLPASFCNQELQECNLFQYIHPDDREKVLHARQGAFGEGEEYRVKYVMVPAEGRERRVIERGYSTPGREPAVIMGYIFDLDAI
ncbi:MAG: response regulator [Methanolinea sp.]|nr:response regulator [Methanolinea sp.]